MVKNNPYLIKGYTWHWAKLYITGRLSFKCIQTHDSGRVLWLNNHLYISISIFTSAFISVHQIYDLGKREVKIMVEQ